MGVLVFDRFDKVAVHVEILTFLLQHPLFHYGKKS